jgi:two-component system, HptB-dependent secretion and biofilm response regulator
MRPLKILSVDDDPTLRMMLKALIRSLGHQCTPVADGMQAIEQYQKEQFDLVLVDQLMPGMDGIATTVALRELQKNSGWRPIIMLSSMDQTDDQVSSLNAGCDDFLAKPVNFGLLAAKINSFQRIASLQQRVAEQHQQLLHYHHAEAEERRISSFLMNRLMRRDLLDRPNVSYLLHPAADISGDLLLACPANNGDIYVMLADATGHGLPAALTLIPLTQTFYSMAGKGFNLNSIAREMNRCNRAYSPTDRFVAALIAVFSPRENVLTVWNGGIPPALLLNDQGQVIRRFKSLNLPLGVASDNEFDSECESMTARPGQRLLLYSDGLVEAENVRGELFGYEHLERNLEQSSDANLLEGLQAALQAHLGECPPHDDLSCLLLECTADDTIAPHSPTAPPELAEDWRVQLTLSATQLRRMDLVPWVTSLCSTLGLEPYRQGVLSLILNELLTNALDHGILTLDSSLKNQPEGFEAYFATRGQRLAALTDAEINIDICQHGLPQGNNLTVQITDSGNGFDTSLLPTLPTSNQTEHYHGRGLELVRNLCQHLEFYPPGNSVKAELRWGGSSQTDPGTPAAVTTRRNRAQAY